VLVLPGVVIFLVIVHVLLVRKHGVVPPFEVRQRAAKSAPAAEPAKVETGAGL
jgi:quinol-cytochrome oxidoreductase complex cytochrome b subunit